MRGSVRPYPSGGYILSAGVGLVREDLPLRAPGRYPQGYDIEPRCVLASLGLFMTAATVFQFAAKALRGADFLVNFHPACR